MALLSEAVYSIEGTNSAASKLSIVLHLFFKKKQAFNMSVCPSSTIIYLENHAVDAKCT